MPDYSDCVPAPEELMERLRTACKLEGLNPPRPDLTEAEAKQFQADIGKRRTGRKRWADEGVL